MNNNSRTALVLWAIFSALFIAGIYGGYLYFSEKAAPEEEEAASVPVSQEDTAFLKVYYPVGGSLKMQERPVPRKSDPSEEALKELFKGRETQGAVAVPRDVKVNAVYKGEDGIVYADLSDEVKTNFEGSALDELMLVTAIYETLSANNPMMADAVILVEASEADSIGGHISIARPVGGGVLGRGRRAR